VIVENLILCLSKILNSKFYSDSIELTINESGDYIIPFEEGIIKREHIVGEIGEIIRGRIKGRENKDEVTVFEALGLAVEDLAAADFIINKEAI
jgi:ornithine cyclodeaminase/alanine dehydrogenase-like protein (mu-crystallin family)